ncbi:endonuclease III [Caldicellulosiruptor acetigenus I77R1B]|uniref:Endonuclease III n=1 Tax=Caldicellulosiruptor acetigenus (strain ATCC 700853 / DSM 12137 / I77R1B) TaxID=632335 RepID=E4S8V8_CALA7|nr:endonuclease III [Caldicellulosiruptor acetigenus]ADQ40955.1 endonuclease III [Caldicellulosiruptor acetigenus I77R1B]WAM37529.1 endonuclease III [Caldicellulosiruptor acetigenus]
MTKKEKASYVIKELLKIYPQPSCTLNYNKPYELLIATILAAQSTDERVNKITAELFKKYPTLESFAEANISELENDIKPVGFYKNKAKSIKETARILVEKYNGTLPTTIEELVKLKGVGRKTANVIMANIYGIPSIIVDTHCKRLSNRLGLVNSKDATKIEFELKKIVEPQLYTIFSNLMVYHGRAVCKAIKPKCEVCTIKDVCEYFKARK